VSLLNKIKTQLILFSFLLLFVIFESNSYAQVSSEQKAQLGKYETMVNEYKKQKQYKKIAYYLYKSAGIYLSAGERQKSIDKYLESAQYYEQIGNYNNKKKIYSNVAFVYADMGQLKDSKKYYNKSLEISRRLNNRTDISSSLMEVASIEIYLRDYSKAESNLNEALKIANLLNDAILLRTCYLLFHQLNKAKGNIKASDQYYNSYIEYDKIVKGERTDKENELADKNNSSENKNEQNISDKNKEQTITHELIGIKRNLTVDSLAITLAVKEDAYNRIEGRNDLIKKINKNLKQNSRNHQQVIDNQTQQLFWANLGISLLFVLAFAGILLYLQKNKAYKQLEQEFNNLKTEMAKIKNESEVI